MIPSSYTRFWDKFDWQLYQRVVDAKFQSEMEDLPKLIEEQQHNNNNDLKNNNNEESN